MHNYDRREWSDIANYRRRFCNKEVYEFLSNAQNSGIEPKRARSIAFKQFCGLLHSENLVIIQDIYNEYARVKASDIVFITPVERTIQILDKDYFYDFLEDRSTLTYLFFAYKDIVSIFKDNSGSRIVLDVTYRTNEYNLPVIVIVVVTAISIYILVVLVYIENKQETDFE